MGWNYGDRNYGDSALNSVIALFRERQGIKCTVTVIPLKLLARAEAVRRKTDIKN